MEKFCKFFDHFFFPQHYPLYRKSDSECIGEDSASPEEKKVLFKEKYDVLSQDASQKVCSLQLIAFYNIGGIILHLCSQSALHSYTFMTG